MSPDHLARFGKHILDLAAHPKGAELFGPHATTQPFTGGPCSELAPTGWGFGIGHFGALTGHNGSYVASTTALFFDRGSQTVVACSINRWDAVIRQLIAQHVAELIGQPQPISPAAEIATPFRIGDIVGRHTPLMFGAPPLTIASDGSCQGAINGQLEDTNEGVRLTAPSLATFGLEAHPQTGAPLVRCAFSLYRKDTA